MRKLDEQEVAPDIQVAFYMDCDEGLNMLPQYDVHKFSDKVYDPFPERKNGRYGATVIVGTQKDWANDPTLERRAIQKAKHLIGLKRQEVALAKRQQGTQHDQGRTEPSGDPPDRPSVERSQRDAVAAEGDDHLISDQAIHAAARYIDAIGSR